MGAVEEGEAEEEDEEEEDERMDGTGRPTASSGAASLCFTRLDQTIGRERSESVSDAEEEGEEEEDGDEAEGPAKEVVVPCT